MESGTVALIFTCLECFFCCYYCRTKKHLKNKNLIWIFPFLVCITVLLYLTKFWCTNISILLCRYAILVQWQIWGRPRHLPPPPATNFFLDFIQFLEIFNKIVSLHPPGLEFSPIYAKWNTGTNSTPTLQYYKMIWQILTDRKRGKTRIRSQSHQECASNEIPA